MVTTYEEALALIHGRTQFKKSDQLKRMHTFLTMLNHPEADLKAIHVAGTNGKGSTVAFLRELLMSEGYTVGTFTSPFLMRFNERISVNGIPIADDDLVKLVNEIVPVIEELDNTYPEGGPTEFEIITAMMFLWFRDHVDVAVIEVGIGGLLDSTNVFTPIVSVITTIGYDHMKLLGNTLPEIAAQKAGIIKPHVPIVAGRIPANAMAVISQTAATVNSHLYQIGQQIEPTIVSESGWQETFDFDFGDSHLKRLKIQLLGDYQVDNASCALAAFILFMQNQSRQLDTRSISSAMGRTNWPGRFEALNHEPLIVIDGAHNVPAIDELVALLKQRFNDREIYVLFAVLADKQHDQMLAKLKSVPNIHIILTTFDGPGSRQVTDPEELAAKYENDNQIEVIENWQLAIGLVAHQMSMDDLFLITGSLYFISDVRTFFG